MSVKPLDPINFHMIVTDDQTDAEEDFNMFPEPYSETHTPTLMGIDAGACGDVRWLRRVLRRSVSSSAASTPPVSPMTPEIMRSTPSFLDISTPPQMPFQILLSQPDSPTRRRTASGLHSALEWAENFRESPARSLTVGFDLGSSIRDASLDEEEVDLLSLEKKA